MQIHGETFRRGRHEDGREGWFYQVICGLRVQGRWRRLQVSRFVSLHDAGGYWYERRGAEYLRELRKRCSDHLRERAEVDDPVLRMRPKPPSRHIVRYDAQGNPVH